MRNQNKQLFILILLFFGLIIHVTGSIRYAVNNGDWDNTSTWSAGSGGASGASIPGNGDIAVIENEYVVTVNSSEHCDSVYIISGSGNDSKLIIVDVGSLDVAGGVLLTTQGNSNKAVMEIKGNGGNPGNVVIGGNLVLKGYDNEDDAKVKVFEDGTLAVSGNISLWTNGDQKSEIKIENNGVVNVSGNIVFTGTEVGRAKVKLRDNAIVNLQGNLDRSAVGNYGDLDCDQTTFFNYCGTNPQIFSMINYGGSVTEKWNYGEVQINNSAGVTLDADINQSNPDITVKDDIRIQNGIMLSGGNSIELANNKYFQLAANTFYISTTTDATGGMLQTSTSAEHDIEVSSTVNFAASGNQNVPRPSNSIPYGNLIISGRATKTLVDNIDVNGDLTIMAATTLDCDALNDYDIDIAGDWTDEGVFDEQKGKVKFNGNARQYINSNVETFYDLKIDKSNEDLYLNTNIIIDKNLNLSNGDIVLGANNVSLNVNATTSNESADSYVQADSTGVIIKQFDAIGIPFNFPVGDMDDYSPYWIDLVGGTTFGGGDFISLNVTDAKHPELGPGDHITRYWTVNSGGFAAISFLYKSVYVDADISGTETNLLAARWDGSSWTSYDVVNAPANSLSNSIAITEIPLNHSFSGGIGSALPIGLISFKAEADESGVVVSWVTGFEINNDFFTIERSENGVDFIAIGIIKGKGTSYQTNKYSFVDHNPVSGISYYRLKQTDYNGSYTFSPSVSVKYFASLAGMKVYPNPVKTGQQLNIEMTGGFAGEKAIVILIDQFGKELFSKVILSRYGELFMAIDIEQKLPEGIYFVIGSSSDKIYRKKIIVMNSNRNAKFAIR